MLPARVLTSICLVGLTLGVLVVDELLAPWYPLWLVASVVVMGWTSLELVNLLDRTSARPSRNTVLGGNLALIGANWVPHIFQALASPEFPVRGGVYLNPLAEVQWLSWPLWSFVAVVMFAFIAQSAQFQKPGGTMATIAGTVLAVAYVGLLGSFLIQLRWFGTNHVGLIAVLLLVATAKGADIGAYTCGRLFGRHKLWPRLSPNKTIEGAIGGLIFGCIAALLLMAAATELLRFQPLSWSETVGYGLVVAAAAQLGDLMESMIKRDCSQKDASDTIPGFGGLLDVMDSLLFAAPVAYAYWLAFSI